MKRANLIVTLITFLLVSSVRAHDLWVVPGKFVLSAGEKCRVFLNSGDEFPISESLLGEHRVQFFRMLTAAGANEISSFVVDGRSLTLELPETEEGTAVLALGTKPRLVRLKAKEFNEYLKEDGLPQILALRESGDDGNQPVVERYAKWAKAILKIGDGEDDTWSKPAGLKIEIVPLENPYEIRPGGVLPVVVLFDGEPLAGLTVTGTRAGGPRRMLRADLI